MKNKNFVFKGFLMLIAFFLIVGINSCSKEEATIQEISLENEFGSYTKELIAYDNANENSAVILVGSNDKSILNMWTSDNLTLIPVYKNQTSKDAVEDFFKTFLVEKNQINFDEDDDSDEIGACVSFMIKSTTLQKNVTNVILYTNDPYDDDLRGWRREFHYSRTNTPRSNITCEISGHNFWRRGYWALWYKPNNSQDDWATIQSQWERIRRGENEVVDRVCHQMRARRKYKGRSNDSVTIAFHY